MARRLTRDERAARLAAVAHGKANGLTMTAVARNLGLKVEVLRQWMQDQEKPRHPLAPERPPTTKRPCLRCEKPFDSEGAHNRLCTYCTSEASRLFSPYAPDPGGSRGRQVRAVRA
jgi:transposase-like protein